MIPQQMTARKKKYIGNACLPVSIPIEGGAGGNADAKSLSQFLKTWPLEPRNP